MRVLFMCFTLLFVFGRFAASQETPGSAPEDPASYEAMLETLATVELRLHEDPEDLGLRLERLRTLYFLGVADEVHLDQADQEVTSIRDLAALEGRDLEPLADAFAGAVEVVRGKHAFWPGSKVIHVRRGLTLLDRSVERAPTSVEIRNLRLLSTFYLPFFFGRGETARSDLAALATLLPSGADEVPTHVWVAISDFVLEHGELTPSDRERLEEYRRRVQDDIAPGAGTEP